jgi:hypothetical protein
VEAYFVPLFAYTWEELHYSNMMRCMGLALVEAKNGRDGEYVRKGRVSVEIGRTAYEGCSLPQAEITII